MRLTCRAVIGLVALLVACATPALAKTYSADRYDSRIRVLPDGVLEVTETAVFRFEAGGFDHIDREISRQRTDAIEIVSGGMDGEVFPFGDDVSQIEVTRGSMVNVRWRFPRVGDSVHTFLLTYRVRGAIFQEDGSQILDWRPLPRERNYRIQAATVEIELPAAVATGQTALPSPEMEWHSVDGAVTSDIQRATGTAGSTAIVARTTAERIRRSGWVRARLRFPRSALAMAPPQWQVAQRQNRALVPRWATAAGLIFCSGLILLVGVRLHYDSPTRDLAPAPPSSGLPLALAPGLVGPLGSSGRASLEHAMAAVFSLAARGVVAIEERPPSLLGQGRFHLRRRRVPHALAAHEAAALAIGMGEANEGETVPLESFRNRLNRRSSRFSKDVQQDLLSSGLIDPARKSIRHRYERLAVAAMILSACAAGAAAIMARSHGGWAFLLPGALALVGLMSLLCAAATTPLSDEGLRQAARWSALRKYLKNVANNRERTPSAHQLDAILPLIVAAGLSSQWGKHLKRHPGSVPGWFRGLAPESKGHAFASFVSAGGAGAPSHG